jgi:hypothetical protein
MTKEEVNLAVANFREKSREQGWEMSRIRPRSGDEIKALNYIARSTFRSALKSGSVQYDKERRVLLIEKYAKR